MTYYTLPNIYPRLKLCNIEFSLTNENTDTTIISKSLRNYLNEIKKQIDSCINEWDIYKKYTNAYEFYRER